jgi:cell division septation protein DedD
MSSDTPVQDPDNGQSHNAARSTDDNGAENPGLASIKQQLMRDHDKYEERLRKLESIILLAGNNLSVVPGNNYPDPASRTSSLAAAGQFVSRPIEPDVITRPVARLPESNTMRAETAVTPATQDPPVKARMPERPRPAGKAGLWAINLGSYTNKKVADRKLEQYQQQDIAAEQVTAVVNNKTMYRLQIPGFQTRQSALSHAESVQEMLGLTDVWIKKM